MPKFMHIKIQWLIDVLNRLSGNEMMLCTIMLHYGMLQCSLMVHYFIINHMLYFKQSLINKCAT